MDDVANRIRANLPPGSLAVVGLGAEADVSEIITGGITLHEALEAAGLLIAYCLSEMPPDIHEAAWEIVLEQVNGITSFTPAMQDH